MSGLTPRTLLEGYVRALLACRHVVSATVGMYVTVYLPFVPFGHRLDSAHNASVNCSDLRAMRAASAKQSGPRPAERKKARHGGAGRARNEVRC
jgi:hypothetical protein